MEKHIIKKIINIWDPLGVFGLAPRDEYDDITEKIICFLEASADRKAIKKYLMGQYYSEKVKNETIVDELIDILYMLI